MKTTRLEMTSDLLDQISHILEKFPDDFWDNDREVEETDIHYAMSVDIPYSIMSDGVIVPYFTLVREQKG
jgi:hypothetical protein